MTTPHDETTTEGYEAPAIRTLGTVHELTGCEKMFGSSDGHTFGGAAIVCSST